MPEDRQTKLEYLRSDITRWSQSLAGACAIFFFAMQILGLPEFHPINLAAMAIGGAALVVWYATRDTPGPN